MKTGGTEFYIGDVVMPNDTTHHGTIFGGKLLEIMDKAAYICGSSFSRESVVTAAIDVVRFKAPIKMGHIVRIHARVVYTGRTSLDVKVDAYGEDPLTGERVYCCTGYFTMVAVDKNIRPIPVPSYSPRTPEEVQEFEAARERRERLKGHSS